MFKTQVEEREANKVALTVEVEEEKVKAAYNSFYKRAARSVKIPGFRNGKAPKAVIAKFIGHDEVREQIEEELLHEVYPKALKEANLNPVSPYELEESDLKENAPFKFKAVFEVQPKLGDFKYTDFSIQVQREIVDDESIEKITDDLKEHYATTEAVEDGTLEYNDYFSADIEISCEGEKDEELSEDKTAQKLTEGDKFYAPCVGMKPGETKTWKYNVSEDDNKFSKYAGKELEVKMELKSISRSKLPELNDEFAKKVGEFNTIDELTTKIREDMEERTKNDAEERAFDQIMENILKEYDFDVPEAMIQNTIDFFIRGLDRRWRQYGTTIEDYLRNSGKDVNEFRESFREKATFETKSSIVLDAIGEKEKIEVTDAEFRDEIEKRAAEYNMPVEKLLETLSQNNGEENVKFSLKTQKIKDFLLKNNQVNYDMVKEAELNKGETE